MVDTKEVLHNLTQRLRIAFTGEVKDIILFGSQLTGNASEESDYDFVLVWKGDKLNYEKKRSISDVCAETDLSFGILTHTLIISEQELAGLRGTQPIFKGALAHGSYAA